MWTGCFWQHHELSSFVVSCLSLQGYFFAWIHIREHRLWGQVSTGTQKVLSPYLWNNWVISACYLGITPVCSHSSHWPARDLRLWGVLLRVPKEWAMLAYFWSPWPERLTLKINLLPLLSPYKMLGIFIRRKGRFSSCFSVPGYC